MIDTRITKVKLVIKKIVPAVTTITPSIQPSNQHPTVQPSIVVSVARGCTKVKQNLEKCEKMSKKNQSRFVVFDLTLDLMKSNIFLSRENRLTRK
jgi:hypothetical protein